MAESSTAYAAVVTGHSRGLGAGIAAHLLARGIPVLGVSRSRNETLADRFRDMLTEVELDLSSDAEARRWLASDALPRFLGGARTALLVNNAGLLQPIGPLEKQDVDGVWRAVAVNVGAVLALSAAFVQRSADAMERRILHISSGAGRKAYAGWSVYCATKAALDHHARAVAMDATPRLRITSIAPGVIDTDMQGEIRESSLDRFPDRERFVAMKREGSLHSPSARGAMLVEFLLSDAFGADPISELPR